MSASRVHTAEPERVSASDYRAVIARLKETARAVTPTHREVVLRARELRVARRVHNIRESGLPEDNWHPVWTRVPLDIRREVGNYCLNLRRHVADRAGAFLGSAPGAGKTSILALVAAAARRDGIYCEYVESGAVLWYEINRRRRHSRFDEGPALFPYDDCPLVLLDDADDLWAGESESTQWSDLTKLLKHRHGRRLTTVLAANKTFDEMCAVVSGRSLDWLPTPDDPAGRMVDRWADCLPFRLETAAESQRGTGAAR